jgi:hypothetical protein
MVVTDRGTTNRLLSWPAALAEASIASMLLGSSHRASTPSLRAVMALHRAAHMPASLQATELMISLSTCLTTSFVGLDTLVARLVPPSVVMVPADGEYLGILDGVAGCISDHLYSCKRIDLSRR